MMSDEKMKYITADERDMSIVVSDGSTCHKNKPKDVSDMTKCVSNGSAPPRDMSMSDFLDVLIRWMSVIAASHSLAAALLTNSSFCFQTAFFTLVQVHIYLIIDIVYEGTCRPLLQHIYSFAIITQGLLCFFQVEHLKDLPLSKDYGMRCSVFGLVTTAVAMFCYVVIRHLLKSATYILRTWTSVGQGNSNMHPPGYSQVTNC